MDEPKALERPPDGKVREPERSRLFLSVATVVVEADPAEVVA